MDGWMDRLIDGARKGDGSMIVKYDEGKSTDGC